MNIESILAKIDVIPPMPVIAIKLLDAAQDPDVDLGEVAGWLQRDPGMTTNLLRVCNAPYYGLRSEVTSVKQATSLLGLRKVVEIAVTVLASRYLTPAQEGYALAAGDLWRNSIVAAMAAELVGRRVRYPNLSAAYTAGLLQDLGKIVLADFVSDALPQIRQRVEQDQVGWEEAERRTVGMPHPEVGALLLERWGFPAALVEAVRTHHTPARAVLDPKLACISHLADALTMTVGMGIGADGLAYELDEVCLAKLGLTGPHPLDALVEELGEKIEQAEELLAPPRSSG